MSATENQIRQKSYGDLANFVKRLAKFRFSRRFFVPLQRLRRFEQSPVHRGRGVSHGGMNVNMEWIILIVAGLCETGFTYSLGRAKCVAGVEWRLFFIVTLIASIVGLKIV